eukprot:GFYU01002320.1.p1 GENE.GFYU01002320.1~~GFYU01002320.1.p1  ORF type:complete len:893 (-),score=187.31 GFYU01002320.1:336-3014(-)
MGTTFSSNDNRSRLEQAIARLVQEAEETSRLNLSGHHFGHIPKQVFVAKLHTHLKSLALDNNGLETLPAEIGLFYCLQHLKLFTNEIVKLPPEIGHLGQLKVLNVGRNKLIALPPEIGNCACLTELTLIGNPLTSLPAEMSRLSQLNSLDVAYCKLQRLPPTFTALENLAKLDCSGNMFDSLDPVLWQMTSLKNLNLSFNQIKNIPYAIGRLKSLTYLDLRLNRLEALPGEIGQLTQLTRLDLRDNRLVELPGEFGNLVALKDAMLNNNQLCRLPAEIATLTNLRALDLRHNEIEELCEQIGDLSSLERIYLDYNRIRELPQSFGNLDQLIDVTVSFNQLSSIDVLFGLTRLDRLNATCNQIIDIGPKISNLTSLRELDVGCNYLSRLPDGLAPLKTLSFLNLFQNSFTELPESVCEIPQLKSLSISYNDIEQLPASIGNITSLRELHCAGTGLTTLPQSLGKLTSLTSLFLGFNQLSSLPEGIGYLPSLRLLDIKGNFLHYLPEELAGLLVNVKMWSSAAALALASNRERNSPSTSSNGGRKSAAMNRHVRHVLESGDISKNSPCKMRRVRSMSSWEDNTDNMAADSFQMQTPLPRLDKEVPVQKGEAALSVGESLMTGRRPCMEDYVTIKRSFRGVRNNHYFAVFDGHSGHEAAEYAALNFHKVLKFLLFHQEGHDNHPMEEIIRQAYLSVNDKMHAMQSNLESGTTALTALVVDKTLYVGNLGDSRAVMCRAGEAVRITYDHRPLHEVGRIREVGGYVTADNRLNGLLGVSRALGDFYLRPSLSCEPEITRFDLGPEEEFIIMATDGLWETISEEAAVEIVRDEKDVWRAADRLRDTAYLLGSSDNISVVVVRFSESPIPAPEPIATSPPNGNLTAGAAGSGGGPSTAT